MAAREYIFNKKNVIVTGGAGFLGSHLCDELVKTSKVICIDNFLSGQEQNIHHLLSNPDFEFVKHDIAYPLDLRLLPNLRKFEVEYQGIQEIYHLASPTAPADYLQYPIETMQASSAGTKVALEWARLYQAPILHMSSAAIYGEPPDVAKPYVREEYWGFTDPVGAFSAFVEGKRFAEALAVQYRRLYKLQVKIVRLFNTFGPRMKLQDSRLIPSAIRQALEGKEIVIEANPGALISACYVKDIVEALLKIMAAKNVDVLNLGSPEKATVAQIIQQVIALTGTKATPRYQAPPLHYSQEPLPDIARIKERIGWIPLVPLKVGLQKTMEYMRASKVVGFAEEVTL